ncbi:hypothetical protein BHE74_00029404 [Ensete ventricosum]|nr:hypothetical protein GW17_00050767 [Ensete ventricosum]RWW63420.1 hypothetical protein BHE74_00029404 [Ensete ventricosum]RZR86358.1 hypothetical protein BHM03_00013545 [Ensete ventricosum]
MKRFCGPYPDTPQVRPPTRKVISGSTFGSDAFIGFIFGVVVPTDPIWHSHHRSELPTVLESSRSKQNPTAINGRKLEGVREGGEMAGRFSGVASRIMGGNGVAARSVASALRSRSGMVWDNGTPCPEPCIDRLAPTVGKYEALAWLCWASSRRSVWWLCGMTKRPRD